jgi:hypothetical protein
MGKKKRKRTKADATPKVVAPCAMTDTAQAVYNRWMSARAYGGIWYDTGVTAECKTVEIGGAEFIVINAGENEDLT